MTRAKKFMSDFIRGHGRVPFSPMPRRGFVVERVMGVVATTRVSVIVFVVGFIDSTVSETGSVEDGGDIYSFSFSDC